LLSTYIFSATRTWHRNIDGIMVGTDSLLICNSENTNVDCSNIGTHHTKQPIWLAVFLYAFLPNCFFLCYACVVLKNRWYTVQPPVTYSPVADSLDDTTPMTIYEKIPNSNNDDFSEINKDKAGLEQIARNKARNWSQRDSALRRDRDRDRGRDIIENDIEESLTSEHLNGENSDRDRDSAPTCTSLSYVSLNISSSANCSSPSSPLSLSLKL
jgi:hypothetical protein